MKCTKPNVQAIPDLQPCGSSDATPRLATTVIIHTYTVVYLVISLPKTPYVHRIYTHTVYGRIFGDFPAENTIYAPPYIHCICTVYIWFWPTYLVISLPKHHICTVYSPYMHRIHMVLANIFGDFPAKNTIYAPYSYRICTVCIWFWPTYLVIFPARNTVHAPHIYSSGLPCCHATVYPHLENSDHVWMPEAHS